MGDMADYYSEYGWADEWYEDHARPAGFMHLSDDELRSRSSGARTKKLKGIRAWPFPLSFKQRYCLAAWIANHENDYV